MSDVTLTAYNVKTKEKNVPIKDAVITKTAKGAYMAQGNDGKGNKLTTLLGEVLEETGYTKRHPANCEEGQIRRLVLRMGVAASDIPVWMGILRQILWKVRGSGER